MNGIITSDKKYIPIYRVSKQKIESIPDPQYWNTISEEVIFNELMDSTVKQLLKHTKDKNIIYLKLSLDTIVENYVPFSHTQVHRPFSCSKFVSYDIISDITYHIEEDYEVTYLY